MMVEVIMQSKYPHRSPPNIIAASPNINVKDGTPRRKTTAEARAFDVDALGEDCPEVVIAVGRS